MKPLYLNFARPRRWWFLPARAGHAGLVVLLLAASAVWAVLLADALHSQQQAQTEVTARAHAAAQRANAIARAAIKQPTLLTSAQVETYNDAIRQLNIPWSALFDAFEGIPTSKAVLVSLEPNAAKGLIRGTAESIHPEAMFAYLTALEASERFTRVALVRQSIQELDPSKPVRFTFDAWFHRSAQAQEGTVR